MVSVGATAPLTDRTDFASKLPAELRDIQEELERMKSEFQALKQITRPLLVEEPKLSSRILRLAQPRKPSRSNSVTTLAKWSWSDPLDAGAGPGSYNVTTDLARKETVSSFLNLPKAFISKTRHLSSEIDGKKGSISPPSTRYTPNTTLVQRQFPKLSFGQADVNRLPEYDRLRKRSPGPIYKAELRGTQGGRISTTKRDTYAGFVRNAYPSPQHYAYEEPKKQRAAQFGTGARDMGVKMYVPGIERYMQGREGELSTNPPDPMTQLTGGSTLKNSGHAQLYTNSAGNPGAGTYPTVWIQSNKGKFSFGKAARRIDIKQSKSHIVGISHDVLRD